MKRRLLFIVESGTDFRMVEGLADHFDIQILARSLIHGRALSQEPDAPYALIMSPTGRAQFAFFVCRWISKFANSVDCVLVQGYGLAALAANLAGRVKSLPVLMIVCSPIAEYYRCRRFENAPDKPFRRREWFAIQCLARLNASFGQGYIALSEYLASVVRSHGAKKPIDVIPVYGVDTEVFKPVQNSKTSARQLLNLPLESRLVLFSSRVAPEKDPLTLLRAVRALAKRYPSITILHLSGGHLEFARLAETMGLKSRVIHAGAAHPHKELPAFYQACDLVVQASREEGLGFSVLEALACEVPVIAASVGGLRETIIDGETGWTYPAGDFETLSRRIETAIYLEPEEAARRAQRGRQRVLERYETKEAFNRLAEAIGELVNSEGELN